MRLMGRGSQLGPNVTAAEAATGYEEVAKTLKGASPAKVARTSRDKSGVCLASTHLPCVSQQGSPSHNRDHVLQKRVVGKWPLQCHHFR